MTDLANQIQALKGKADKAHRDRTRAEMERDSAIVELAKARDKLRAEHGVESVQQGKAKLSALTEELEIVVTQIKSALEQMG